MSKAIDLTKPIEVGESPDGFCTFWIKTEVEPSTSATEHAYCRLFEASPQLYELCTYFQSAIKYVGRKPDDNTYQVDLAPDIRANLGAVLEKIEGKEQQ